MSAGPDLDGARYARMRWNTPLSVAHADRLLERLAIGQGDSLLDLGCGWAELLIRALGQTGDAVTAIGVDTDAAALARGRERAAELGLADRLSLVEASAPEWSDPSDRVICVGTAHAWGGAAAALDALAGLLRPGGRVLFGDGCWEQPPTGEAMALFGDSVVALGELIELSVAGGWRVLHLSTADQAEWDEFESTWRAGRQEWLLAHPGDGRAPQLAAEVDAQLAEYVNVYRGVLGFGYLVLAR